MMVYLAEINLEFSVEKRNDHDKLFVFMENLSHALHIYIGPYGVGMHNNLIDLRLGYHNHLDKTV